MSIRLKPGLPLGVWVGRVSVGGGVSASGGAGTRTVASTVTWSVSALTMEAGVGRGPVSAASAAVVDW